MGTGAVVNNKARLQGRAGRRQGVSSDILAQIESAVLARHGKRQGSEIRFLCPAHDDHNPSAYWNPEKKTWHCFACGAGGGWKDLAERLGIPIPSRSEIVAKYDYIDENGKLLFQVVRKKPKDFLQRQPCPKGGNCGERNEKGEPICKMDPDGSWWHWNTDGVRIVPYRLPQIIKAVGQGELIFIVEGEKDADHLARIGLVATTNPRGAGNWPDTEDFNKPFAGAKVCILPDNDEPGRRHAQQVARILHGRAANIKVLELPDLPLKGDVSDWLSQGGTREKLLEMVAQTPEWHPQPNDNQETRQPTEEAKRKVPGMPDYVVEKGIIYRVTFNKDGDEVYEPLSNFEAEIVCEIVKDDGAEQTHVFEIEGRLCTGEPLPRISVPASEYSSLSWVTANWGVRPLVLPGYSKKDHLRAAIQILSGEVPRRTVYTHTGWRKVEGKWVYLTTGGGIESEGLVPGIEVELEKSLRDYYLPEPPEGERLKEAVRCSLKLLDLGPERITAPLLGAVYLAPLGEATELDLSLFLAGRTGGFKTATAAVMLSHWGPSWNDRNLPGGWDSTANALERAAFLAKDAVFVVDDFVPKGNASEIQRTHREADRLLRAQANRQGRQRMNADRTLAAEYFPRGIVISSGEDLPVGHSLNARMCIIEVTAPDRGTPGDIDVARLTKAQEWAAKGFLAEAMAGYVKWLAPQVDELKKTLGEVRRQLRQEAYREGQHRRTPDMVAALCLGWAMWLKFAEAVGAITANEKEELSQRAWLGLGEMAEAQAEHLASEDVANRFLSLLSAAIASGRAHIANIEDGREPSDPEVWGWKEESTGEWRPQGELIGWLDGVNVYLEPETAYAVAQKLARDQNSSLPVSARTLWKRLREKGLLTATEGAKNTVKRQITREGRKRRVLCLHFMSLLSSEKGDMGDSGDLPRSEAQKKSPFPEFHVENGGPEKGTETVPDTETRSPIPGPPLSSHREKWGTKTGQNLPDREAKSPKSPKSPVVGEDTQENLGEPHYGQEPKAEAEPSPLSAFVTFNTLNYRRDPKTGEWVYDPGWYEREIPRRGRDLP